MIVLKNGTLIDGSGLSRRSADILIDGEKIAKIFPAGSVKADNGIDISGKIVCPGFMDIHAHSELEVLRAPAMSHKVSQGITFDLSGNCGVGVFPRRIDDEPAFADILGHWNCWNWTDFNSYSDKVKCGINMGFLQNHAMLRKAAIKGNPNREASKEEVATMCRLLDEALSQGCFGLSSGIYYAPNIFASGYEYIELLKIVKKHDAVFTVHHRCEGSEIISSVEEVLSYMRETGVRLEISHLKAIGRANASKVDEVLKMLHREKENGFDVAFDQYPYAYGSTSLFSLLPPRLLRLEQQDLLKELKETVKDEGKKAALIKEIENPEGWDSIIQLCGFDNIVAVILESSPEFNGMTITECAEKLKTDPYTALFTLLSEETKCALMIDYYESEETVKKIMTDSLMSFGTDALYAGGGAHPRSGNAAIRLISEYALKQNTMSLEETIHRMTFKNAEKLKIRDRGLVKEGMYADLVVFDSETLKDNSNPLDPFKRCDGLDYVFINGVQAIKNGALTGSVSGKVIKQA